MKKLILSIIAIATISLSSFGQSPEGFKYQAVIRDAGNLILNNQSVGMRMTIQQGSVGGTSVYSETYSPTTNGFGLVNLEIGTGVTTDNFSTIDWANGPYFIETAVDITGGTSYTVMGTSQLMSVPYALYAKTAENVANDQVNDADANPSNEIQNISGSGLSGTNLTIGIQGGNNQVVDLSSLQDGTGTDDQNIQGSGLSGTDLTIGIQGGNNQTIDLSPLLGDLVDADGDTKIQVEEGNDDDVIRLDVEGTEYFRFVKGRVNLNNTGYSTIYGQAAGVNDDLTNNNNSYFGAFSGNANVDANGNTGIGYATLPSNTLGDGNTAVGMQALYSSESGAYNVAIGYNAIVLNIDGVSNTGIGAFALDAATTGGQNVAIGRNAINENTDGWNNTVVGAYSLNSATTGSNNVSIGLASLYSALNTDRTVAIGVESGYFATGSDNVFIGYRAGSNEFNSNRLHIENSNTVTPLIYGEFDNDLIRINGEFESTTTAKIGTINTGSESDPQAASTIHAGDGFLVSPWVYTNAIHAQSERGTGSTLITVGNDGNFGANNQINFMTNGTKRMTLMDGGLGLNEENPDSDLDIKQSSNSINVGGTGGIRFSSSTLSTWDWRIYNDGAYLSFNSPSARVAYVTITGAWVQNSDRTMKKNISPLSSVLDRVMQLKPVDYHYNQQKDSDNKVIGFVAQEVEPLFPEIVVHSEGKLGMTYANTGVIAIKAVQEQQEIINAQQQEIDLLKSKLNEFQSQLEVLLKENK